MGFHGTPSTNHPQALACGVHCDGRFVGGLVGHCVSLCCACQQFKRQFTAHGSSQSEFDAISFNWPHFAWHPLTVKAKRKTPAVCRRILFTGLLALFDQHLVARLARHPNFQSLGAVGRHQFHLRMAGLCFGLCAKERQADTVNCA